MCGNKNYKIKIFKEIDKLQIHKVYIIMYVLCWRNIIVFFSAVERGRNISHLRNVLWLW